MAGGVLIDSGWLRLLGAGSSRLSGSLRSWNDGTVDTFGLAGRAVLVAHDAAGELWGWPTSGAASWAWPPAECSPPGALTGHPTR